MWEKPMFSKSTEFVFKHNVLRTSCVDLDTLDKSLLLYVKYLLCAIMLYVSKYHG